MQVLRSKGLSHAGFAGRREGDGEGVSDDRRGCGRLFRMMLKFTIGCGQETSVGGANRGRLPAEIEFPGPYFDKLLTEKALGDQHEGPCGLAVCVVLSTGTYESETSEPVTSYPEPILRSMRGRGSFPPSSPDRLPATDGVGCGRGGRLGRLRILATERRGKRWPVRDVAVRSACRCQGGRRPAVLDGSRLGSAVTITSGCRLHGGPRGLAYRLAANGSGLATRFQLAGRLESSFGTAHADRGATGPGAGVGVGRDAMAARPLSFGGRRRPSFDGGWCFCRLAAINQGSAAERRLRLTKCPPSRRFAFGRVAEIDHSIAIATGATRFSASRNAEASPVIHRVVAVAPLRPRQHGGSDEPGGREWASCRWRTKRVPAAAKNRCVTRGCAGRAGGPAHCPLGRPAAGCLSFLVNSAGDRREGKPLRVGVGSWKKCRTFRCLMRFAAIRSRRPRVL